MEQECKMIVEDDEENIKILSINAGVKYVLEHVFSHPEAKKEMQNMLLDFWDKCENCVSPDKEYCEFDVLCMFALDWAYKNNGPTKSAVLRSIYCYLEQTNLSTESYSIIASRNDIISSTDSSFVRVLRDFPNFNSAVKEAFIINAMLESFLGGNFGLSKFLVKFGLVEFPSEANEKGRKIVAKLVSFFNSTYTNDEITPEEDRIYIESDSLFSEMQQNKNENFRRLILVFCYICIIAEHRAFVEIEMRHDLMKDYLRFYSYRKLKCLYLFIETTTEAIVIFKDIDKFLSTVLSKQLNEAAFITLYKTSRELFSKMHDYYNPRSLKHLARSKVRESLGNSGVLPKSVYQLSIPVVLKEFVTFEEREIWKALKVDQRDIHARYTFSRLLDV